MRLDRSFGHRRSGRDADEIIGRQSLQRAELKALKKATNYEKMTRVEKKEFQVLKFSMTDYNVSRYSNRNSKYELMSDKRESLINKLRANQSEIRERQRSQITINNSNTNSVNNQNLLFVGQVDIDSKFDCEEQEEDAAEQSQNQSRS